MCSSSSVPSVNLPKLTLVSSKMRSSKIIFAILCLISLEFIRNTQGIRLCGTRLADTLNFVCEQHGGFHGPQKRSNYQGSPESVAHAIFRRTFDETIATDHTIERLGIVNECCRKDCTIRTLISYCSQAQQIDNSEWLTSLEAHLNNLGRNTEVLSNLTLVSGTISSEEMPQDAAEDSVPTVNLGHFRRNQPVFIVLNQPEDESPSNLEEYRF